MNWGQVAAALDIIMTITGNKEEWESFINNQADEADINTMMQHQWDYQYNKNYAVGIDLLIIRCGFKYSQIVNDKLEKK